MADQSKKDEVRARSIAGVQAIFDRYHLLEKERPGGHRDFDFDIMNTAKILDAGPEGWVLFELKIMDNWSNLNNVMHGGAYGVIFDMCTTTALGPLARPGYWDFLGGVTRSLNISYLRGVPLKSTVRIRSWVVQYGRTMAMIRSEMTSEDGKTVYATCEHHKVNVATPPDHMAVRIPWDDEIERIHQAEQEAKKTRNGKAGEKGKL
ncbi:hypothetical protein P152DRAFT_461229 [Eremomyces bilateralis CBS 781.70]|uniref:Thioesterase domain-containing protein n=1 Tax=Eremomyces bilateralis CBS 781.70 TaxID=1392243 RepID=A0A6G1FVN4_9PEZI|nr:uncharacterized protein P152DRAFT_461229 [Eremomyces bilateralis CBS 781.70]KAF1809833.1 hypothetical protein P152DRAFT_461229 [Eremomyces bilateralis CBS 781.70]